MFSDALLLLPKALGETVYMVGVSMVIASAIGIPLGVLLLATGKNQILELGIANKTLSAVVNCVRSIPFIILMVAIIPFTRLVCISFLASSMPVHRYAMCISRQESKALMNFLLSGPDDRSTTATGVSSTVPLR